MWYCCAVTTPDAKVVWQQRSRSSHWVSFCRWWLSVARREWARRGAAHSPKVTDPADLDQTPHCRSTYRRCRNRHHLECVSGPIWHDVEIMLNPSRAPLYLSEIPPVEIRGACVSRCVGLISLFACSTDDAAAGSSCWRLARSLERLLVSLATAGVTLGV
jgi:hypothetical protein